jgi:abortive infection bacteriophage resistance protein
MNTKQFIKKATSIKDQIQILKSRHLTVPDEIQTEHCLKTVSFHRLSAYCRLYEKDTVSHYFKSNITFSYVWDLYVFDRELRLLVLDAIERIEIAIRTSLSNVMSITYDPLWYCSNEVFKSEYCSDGSASNQMINGCNRLAFCGNAILNDWKNHQQVPCRTPLSAKMSKDLKSQGV